MDKCLWSPPAGISASGAARGPKCQRVAGDGGAARAGMDGRTARSASQVVDLCEFFEHDVVNLRDADPSRPAHGIIFETQPHANGREYPAALLAAKEQDVVWFRANVGHGCLCLSEC